MNGSIAIIGGGIVGSTIAWKLSKSGYKNVTVFEKNPSFWGRNQSTTNEGTIHSGIYYPKESMPLKSSLCVKGVLLMYAFLEKHNIPFKKTGKLIVATNEYEEQLLNFFKSIGEENGVEGIQKIPPSDVYKFIPSAENIRCALHIPSAGIADTKILLETIVSEAKKQKVNFSYQAEVTKIQPEKNGFLISVQNEKKYFDCVINAAGLFADEVARMVNPENKWKIIPVRGEFSIFNKSNRDELSIAPIHVYQPPYSYTLKEEMMNIVQLPIIQLRKRLKDGSIFITAGLHLSPQLKEGIDTFTENETVSPLKTTGVGKDDYDSQLHPPIDYIKKIKPFFPNLRDEDLHFDHSGIMATLEGYRDFVIEKDANYPNFINLIGMESPAWTACFAISEYVRNLMN